MFVKLFQGLKENVLVVAQRKTRSHCPRLERGKKQRRLFLQRQRNCWKVCHLTVIKFSYNLEVFNWLIFYSCKNCKTSWGRTSFQKCVTLIFYWPLINSSFVSNVMKRPVYNFSFRYKSRWGVVIGNTQVVLQACVMTGRKVSWYSTSVYFAVTHVQIDFVF